jgi:orotate phosphoribosyltransferase
LRSQNIEVTGMVAIFTYGFDISVENFKNENLKLETLSNYNTLVECALKNNYIKSEDLKQLITWNSNPSEW